MPINPKLQATKKHDTKQLNEFQKMADTFVFWFPCRRASEKLSVWYSWLPQADVSPGKAQIQKLSRTKPHEHAKGEHRIVIAICLVDSFAIFVKNANMTKHGREIYES